MGLSKSTRICILLAIDTVFFLIELITGMSAYHPGRATTDILTKHQAMPSILLPSWPTLSTWSVVLFLPNYNLRKTHTSGQLNDVISLLVGLWAVKVANQKTTSKMYTYGVRTHTSVHKSLTNSHSASGNAPKP